MIRGLYTSALGMINNMRRMDVTTNNMANADTTSFKRDHVVSHQFTELVMHRLNDPWNMPGPRLFMSTPIGPVAPGVFVDDVFTDWTNGPMRYTGSAFDVAFSGPPPVDAAARSHVGFFTVQLLNGETVFTRDGTFTQGTDPEDGSLRLLTVTGHRVMGENGPITLPEPMGELVIQDSGRVYARMLQPGGEWALQYIDTLALTSFTDLHTLRKMENNFFRTTADSVPMAFEGRVNQGFLENSNVNSVNEMVQMIVNSRAFETNSRILTVQDQTLQRAVNDIAGR